MNIVLDNVDKEKTVAQLKNFLKSLDIILSQPTADVSTAFIKLAKKVRFYSILYNFHDLIIQLSKINSDKVSEIFSNSTFLTNIYISALKRNCHLTKKLRDNKNGLK